MAFKKFNAVKTKNLKVSEKENGCSKVETEKKEENANKEKGSK
jgi:hypothetical protein